MKISRRYPLSAIVPYFTMFPLEFPYGVIRRRTEEFDSVADPFCGRGTTNFAARILGIKTEGIDSNPVAVAITESKLVKVSPSTIRRECRRILNDTSVAIERPEGEFWDYAYHPDTLSDLCRLRSALLSDCSKPSRIALRGIVLGALHGPLTKVTPSYFSNQSPRTYAPKPKYAVKFWKARSMRPAQVDVLGVVSRRAHRYFQKLHRVAYTVVSGDSRSKASFSSLKMSKRLFVTSPPYYGMATYIPDQWIRNWFLGGPNTVEYSAEGQVAHSSVEDFATDLRSVWRNCSKVSAAGSTLVVRFGAISNRRVDPSEVVKLSLDDTDWRILTIRPAGDASLGRRQFHQFQRGNRPAMREVDLWARMD